VAGTSTFLTTTTTNSISFTYPAATTISIQVSSVEYTSAGVEMKSELSKAFTAATAPEAASGLTVTQTTPSTVSLTWNEVPGATGYIVYRSLASKNKYSFKKIVNSTVYMDEQLASGQAYDYKVCAYAYSKAYYGEASNVINTSTNAAKMVF
jgi:fibronectin type 3 domain-containing protein